MDKAAMQAALLGWYDRHARVMPWRVGPDARAAGVRPDPYRVWLSEVMLQQTTVVAVRDFFLRFVARWPDVAALAAAPDAEVMGQWAGLGYYSRARNLLACARAVVQSHGGVFPADRAALLRLPGIGPYTASAIAAIAFDQPETVVDGNVERVMARLHAVGVPLPGSKPALVAHAAALTPLLRPGDHAQAVMDLGATICTPRKPACGICPWRDNCAGLALGIAADLPRKSPKKAQALRLGHAYVGQRADGAWLLETRPPRGLLGGMLGWPGSEWTGADWTGADWTGPNWPGPNWPGPNWPGPNWPGPNWPGPNWTGPNWAPAPLPPVPADWAQVGEVRHTFTHFHLRLTVWSARLPERAMPERGQFHPDAGFDPETLPTVMRKVHALAVATLRHD